MNTGTGKLFFGYLCLYLLIHSATAAQVPISGKQSDYLSVTVGGSSFESGMTGTSGGIILTPSRSEILGEFMDLALDLENPASGHSVTKWARPSVSVQVSGDTDERSRHCLAEGGGGVGCGGGGGGGGGVVGVVHRGPRRE